jgi:GNAT superfamily N-acetyltransferase
VIAELDGTPVGFAVFFASYSTWEATPGLYLEDLFVRPEARGKGVGRELLEHVARLTVARGWARLEWRVLDWNEPSIRFYKSLGATVMPEWELVRMTQPGIAVLAKG